jgi:hypothetical protein
MLRLGAMFADKMTALHTEVPFGGEQARVTRA